MAATEPLAEAFEPCYACDGKGWRDLTDLPPGAPVRRVRQPIDELGYRVGCDRCNDTGSLQRVKPGDYWYAWSNAIGGAYKGCRLTVLVLAIVDGLYRARVWQASGECYDEWLPRSWFDGIGLQLCCRMESKGCHFNHKRYRYWFPSPAFGGPP